MSIIQHMMSDIDFKLPFELSFDKYTTIEAIIEHDTVKMIEQITSQMTTIAHKINSLLCDSPDKIEWVDKVYVKRMNLAPTIQFQSTKKCRIQLFPNISRPVIICWFSNINEHEVMIMEKLYEIFKSLGAQLIDIDIFNSREKIPTLVVPYPTKELLNTLQNSHREKAITEGLLKQHH